MTSSSLIQGSGWGWLGYNKDSGKLQIAACPNQDPLEATTGLVPLFGIDVWEHAYYLQYKNVRPDYVKAIFQVSQSFYFFFCFFLRVLKLPIYCKVANWNDVSARLAAAMK